MPPIKYGFEADLTTNHFHTARNSHPDYMNDGRHEHIDHNDRSQKRKDSSTFTKTHCVQSSTSNTNVRKQIEMNEWMNETLLNKHDN